MRIRMKFGDRLLLRWAADLLMLVGIASILLFAWSLLDGTFYQYTQKRQFNAEVAGGVPGIAKPIAVPEIRPQPQSRFQLMPTPPKGRGTDPLLIGELDVPRLGLSVMVRDGMDAETLRRAVGHVPSTALPGQMGNFVVIAHRDTFFRPLRELEKGDTVQIVTTRGRFSYTVESLEVVEPEGIRLTAPKTEAIATLITCFPFNYVGPAPRRFVARARLREAF
jgi:sortase A